MNYSVPPRFKAAKTARSAVVAIVSAVVVAAVVIAFLAIHVFGFGWFSRLTADFRGETAVIERVHANPNYRIANYDHFYDLCAAIQADEDRIANLEQELASRLDRDDISFRVSQIESSLTAIRNSRSAKIRQYNADAHKTETRANFLASDLPFELDQARSTTLCTASE